MKREGNVNARKRAACACGCALACGVDGRLGDGGVSGHEWARGGASGKRAHGPAPRRQAAPAPEGERALRLSLRPAPRPTCLFPLLSSPFPLFSSLFPLPSPLFPLSSSLSPAFPVPPLRRLRPPCSQHRSQPVHSASHGVAPRRLPPSPLDPSGVSPRSPRSSLPSSASLDRRCAGPLSVRRAPPRLLEAPRHGCAGALPN